MQGHLQKRSTSAVGKHRSPVASFVPARRAPGRILTLVGILMFVVRATHLIFAADDQLAKDARADKVLVLKSERTLELLDHGNVLKKYKIALGGAPVGKKKKQGDHKTPEGLYILDRRNEHSQFYRSLHISYPSAEDRDHAKKSGAAPGGDIMLHGLPNGYGWIGSSHRLRDWTDGCIAVTNEEIDEIWRAVADGTPIEIRP